ncbi:MAG: hypothetical protein ACOY82_05660 [Pseudomonadota bacterium]
MRMPTLLAATAAAIALASAAVYAERLDLFASSTSADPPPAERSPDLPPPPSIEDERRLPLNDFGVTNAHVGDADSFGRGVRWLGLSQGLVYFDTACPRPGMPAAATCIRLGSLTAETAFDAPDLARIELPAGSTASMLCHWLSPLVGLTHQNITTSRVYSYLSYWPTVTVRSDVLDDPMLINPLTGAPFGGQLTIPLTSHGGMVQKALEPGVMLAERSRDSQTCVGGTITRRALIETYGLSPAQANAVFANPMQLSIGMKGVLQNIRYGYIHFGVRFVGD